MTLHMHMQASTHSLGVCMCPMPAYGASMQPHLHSGRHSTRSWCFTTTRTQLPSLAVAAAIQCRAQTKQSHSVLPSPPCTTANRVPILPRAPSACYCMRAQNNSRLQQLERQQRAADEDDQQREFTLLQQMYGFAERVRGATCEVCVISNLQ